MSDTESKETSPNKQGSPNSSGAGAQEAWDSGTAPDTAQESQQSTSKNVFMK